MKVIGYPRVSTLAQDSRGYSLNDQVTAIESFCRKEGLTLTAHFVEVESAATLKDRPNFRAALKHLFNSDAEAIIITNLDRFSRSVLDGEVIRQALARNGKRLISIQEQYLTPTRAGDPDHDEYLQTAFQHRMVEAEAERKRIRRRILTGKKAKSESGGWIGFRPPYEYDVIQGELVINPERAAIVRYIRRLRYWMGWTYEAIAVFLNEKQVPPPHARRPLKKRQRESGFPQRGTGAWTMNSVYNILRRMRESGRDYSDRKGILKEFRRNMPA
jgi:site-specific DNA recombinase